jgi:uncharacterized SAM-binding protein YcdF (DUF218 family)
MRRWLIILALAAGLPLAISLVVITRRIEHQSSIDEAHPADIIVVLGAAEYNGRPSPVLKARLNHAYDLFQRGLAPLIFTTGGSGGDQQYTEGQVGRDYLVRRGIPAEAIVVEGEGDTTVETLVTVSEIMRRMELRSAILVSDGYHIYRAKRILLNAGVRVYGSPRPHIARGTWRERWLYLRQAVAFLVWRIHIPI